MGGGARCPQSAYTRRNSPHNATPLQDERCGLSTGRLTTPVLMRQVEQGGAERGTW